MKKNYVLDTNVLIHCPDAIYKFEDNNVFLCPQVIEELNRHKKDFGETGYNVREAFRHIDSFLKNRTDQLFCHFNRVIKSHKRQFYQMMRRIFIHIKKQYSMDYLSKTAYKSQVERIIKYGYYTELFLRKIRRCSCLLSCYFEI